MNTTVSILPSSSLDDILCKDGEILDSARFWPVSDPAQYSDESSLSITLGKKFEVPRGTDFLALHSLPDSMRVQIFQAVDRSLSFQVCDSTVSGSIPWGLPLRPVRKAVGVGDLLVCLLDDDLVCLRWTGTGYEWLGNFPDAPSASFQARPESLSPYSAVSSEYPQLAVKVSSTAAVREAVIEAYNSFLSDVSAAGLFFSEVKVGAAWQLRDGSLWQSGEPVILESPDAGVPVSIDVVQSEWADGYLYLTLRISRRPFSVVMNAPSVPASWAFMIDGVQMLGAGTPFPEVYGSMMEKGRVPADIYGFANRLYALFDHDGGSLLKDSVPGMAPVCRSQALIGSRVVGMCRSLKSSSSGVPLYLFCTDGVRTATERNGSFLETQLISRDVVLGPDSLAPLADSAAFITAAGIMVAKGNSVSSLSPSSDIPVNIAVSPPDGEVFDSRDRIVCLYRENAVLLYRRGEESCFIYYLDSKTWRKCTGSFSAHHYAWPEVIVMQSTSGGSAVGFPQVETTTPGGSDIVTAAPGHLATIKTRPLKLGNPFAVKKLEEVEAIWPDGSRLALKLYGAMRLGKWYFLGMAPGGRMLTRGSGWRFFRVETFAKFTPSGWIFPTIRFKTPSNKN